MHKLWITTLAAAISCGLLMSFGTAYSEPSPHQIVENITQSNDVYFNQRSQVKKAAVERVGLSNQAALNIARQSVNPRLMTSAEQQTISTAPVQVPKSPRHTALSKFIKLLSSKDPQDGHANSPSSHYNPHHWSKGIVYTSGNESLPNSRGKLIVVSAPPEPPKAKMFFALTNQSQVAPRMRSESQGNNAADMTKRADLKKEVDRWIMDEINGPKMTARQSKGQRDVPMKNVFARDNVNKNRQHQPMMAEKISFPNQVKWAEEQNSYSSRNNRATSQNYLSRFLRRVSGQETNAKLIKEANLHPRYYYPQKSKYRTFKGIQNQPVQEQKTQEGVTSGQISVSSNQESKSENRKTVEEGV